MCVITELQIQLKEENVTFQRCFKSDSERADFISGYIRRFYCFAKFYFPKRHHISTDMFLMSYKKWPETYIVEKKIIHDT